MSVSTIYEPPWNWSIRAEIKIGRSQEYMKKATASHDLRNFFEKNNAPSYNAEVGIMSYQFTEREWNNQKYDNQEGWLDWMRRQKKEKHVNFKLIGGPKIRAKTELSELLSESVIEKIAILPEHETFHVVYCTNPQLLWVEQYHKNKDAKKVYSTNKPFEHSWEEMLGLFNELWEISEKVKEIK